MMPSADKVKEFQKTVYFFYNQNMRKVEMPWRMDHSPYHVLLSEFMLQQTQVKRVLEYYNIFTTLWPTIEDIAAAPFNDVLLHWQGLGYNRRAKFLHRCVQEICDKHEGKIPCSEEVLITLPGIGVYTASAIMSFAFNKPSAMLETNIRRAIIHWFFEGQDKVDESRIRQVVWDTLDRSNPRVWYWALMDYGAHLSTQIKNPNRRSKIYRKQSKFEGSNRQVRGAIVRTILRNSATILMLQKTIKTQLPPSIDDKVMKEMIAYNLDSLEKEGFLVKEQERYYIASESTPESTLKSTPESMSKSMPKSILDASSKDE